MCLDHQAVHITERRRNPTLVIDGGEAVDHDSGRADPCWREQLVRAVEVCGREAIRGRGRRRA
jgi:hypothetical protein